MQETSGVPNSPFFHTHCGAATWSGYDLRASTAMQISEGAIAVNVFDTRQNMLVFEGFAQDRVTEGMRDRLGETINDAIAIVLETFP